MNFLCWTKIVTFKIEFKITFPDNDGVSIAFLKTSLTKQDITKIKEKCKRNRLLLK